ncbi:MAG: LPS export ABC transporter periplasmic protein LptC [Gemmatimonadota bacterium]
MKRIALAALAAILAGCNGSTAPVDENYQSLPADQVAFGVEHITTVNGVRRANLHADTTLMFNDSAVVSLKSVELELYDEIGGHQATLTSASGELNRSTNAMVARGDVVLVVHGAQGRTVWTEELHYDPTQNRIWSDVATRSRTADGQEIRGDSFSSDDQFRNFTIQGGSGTGLQLF